MSVHRDLHGQINTLEKDYQRLRLNIRYVYICSRKNNTDGTNVAQGSLILLQELEHA